MDDEIVNYEANLERDYEALTEKHKAVKQQLETALSSYLKGEKVKPVTIQGPYGSGKTQLLYHLFKFTWENGGVGIYTHLEKIIPSQEMGPLEYAEYLRELVKKEIDMLRKDQSKLMATKVKDYAVSHIKQASNSADRVVLFVDEVEQQYRPLDLKVHTDDHSPLREVIARVNNGEAGFYLILAFAPVSFYEFSKGEAQTGRFLPVILPIVEPKTFRAIFGEIGNLIWWMGKGRYRGVSRTRDIIKANVLNIKQISKKELLDVCNNIGSIGDVPALEFENIEKIDAFEDFRDFLIRLEPKEEGGEIHCGAVKVVKKCRVYDGEKNNLIDVLEKSLRSSGISKITDICYYLSVIFDALSTFDGKMPLFTDPTDWKELLNMVEDIILEFEGEARLPSEDLMKLQNNVPDFSYDVRRNAESIGGLGEGYCIAPSYLRILFPFPISSPNLTNKKIEEQRENLGDQTYLAREEWNGISAFFFLNEDKIKEYLIGESRSYLKETRALVAINLGSEKEIDLPKLARWLQKEGRLKVVTPTRILSDFLASYFHWVRNEKGENLPITGAFEKLAQYQSIPEKDRARKIAYYTSRVKEYLNSELPKLSSQKYTLNDKTGFDEVARVGFVSEVIGFSFVDGKNDWQAIHKFRSEFEKTQFLSKESKSKQTGVPTAVENLVVVDRKTKSVTLGAVLRRISDSFGKHLPDLIEVVDEISKDEFMTIPADDESAKIFEGIYLYLKEWKDPSKAEEKFQQAKSDWNGFTIRIRKLSEKIEEFEKLVGKNILMTHILQSDENIVAAIGKMLGDYQTKISPYTKFLLSTFIEKTIEVAEPKLNEIEKNFAEFQSSVNDRIEEYTSAFGNIETFEKDTFEWINKNKDDAKKEFQQKFLYICQDFTKGGKIDLAHLPDAVPFVEGVGEIADELRTLGEINDAVKECKKNSERINEKLKEWEAT